MFKLAQAATETGSTDQDVIIAILLFAAFLVACSSVVLLKKPRGLSANYTKLLGLIFVAVSAVVLALAEVNTEARTGAYTLLGAIAGYLAGRTVPATTSDAAAGAAKSAPKRAAKGAAKGAAKKSPPQLYEDLI